MPSNDAMMPVSTKTLFRLMPRFVRSATTAMLAFALFGCAGTTNIQESQLAIVPTEPSTSFSRPSQSVIGELGLTPDLLGSPVDLEHNPSLLAAPPSTRALVVSESWYLRAQNDLEVPISTSLDRYLRAAHFSYDALFTDAACKGTQQSADQGVCAALLSAYNRATREIARLTHNGAQLSLSDGTYHALAPREDEGALKLSEWELTLVDLPAQHSSPTFGVSGAACQTINADVTGGATYLRRCTPVAFVVTFAQRAGDGRSSAEIAAYPVLTTSTLALHGRDLALPLDERESWNQLLAGPTTTYPIEAGCLAPTEGALPTVLFALQSSPTDYNWSAIAAALSSAPSMHERFNFCVYNSNGPAAGNAARIVDVLNALSAAPTHHSTVILVAQGAPAEDLLGALKGSLKGQRGGRTAQPLFLAGSLVIPTPRTSTTTVGIVELPSSELSERDQGPLRDIRRLLTKLSDADDGVLGAARRSSVTLTPGMNLSPVM